MAGNDTFDQSITEHAPSVVTCLDTRVMRQRGGKYETGAAAYDVFVRALANRFGRGCRAQCARIAFFGRENARAAIRGFAAPSSLSIEHMHRIAGREGSNGREAGVSEPA